MAWRTYSCQFCAGMKHIEIGRNIDDVQEKVEMCPLCLGKGYLNVPYNMSRPPSEGFIKRMNGDGGLV